MKIAAPATSFVYATTLVLILAGLVLGTYMAEAQRSAPPPPGGGNNNSPCRTSRPVISPNGGIFKGPVRVTISGGGRGATIYYTLDGSEPTTSSAKYTGPFTLTESTVVKAIAVRGNCDPSSVVTAEFFICDPCFIIAVLGSEGAPTSRVAATLKTMVETVQPWVKYKDKVLIIETSGGDVGCREYLHEGELIYPLCPEEDKIIGAVGGIEWDAIVVTTNNECDCANVNRVGHLIANVGQSASVGLLAHELGHSVGTMVDEYFYTFNYEGGPAGPNCFTSKDSCTEKIKDFPDLECATGCRAVEQFRPHTKLMHYELSEPFGSYDECIMEYAITKVLELDTPENCSTQPPRPDPAPEPPQQGVFWGWRR